MIESFYNTAQVDPDCLVFRSRGYSSNSNSDVASLLAKQPPFLRTLLITDGTVTRSLESFFWEPINIEQRTLKVVTAEQSIAWLNAKKNEQLLIREVQLVGQQSKTIYTTAYSLIRLQQVPNDIREKLIQSGIGIGVLISQFGVESYREILDIGYSPNLNFDDGNLSQNNESDILYRSYRILVKQEPTILITEKFPTNIYS